MQVTREAETFLFISFHIQLEQLAHLFCMKNVTHSDSSLVGDGLQNGNLGLGIVIIRVTLSEEPKADERVSNFERKNEADPSAV